MLVDLTLSQVMALANIVATNIQQPDHIEVHHDVVRGVDTTPEELLRLLVDVGAGQRQWPEEADRQLLLLALAICALDAPGFDQALRGIAAQLRGGPGEQDGTPMYEVFKRFNRDRWLASPPATKVDG
jgi:hypothetical protein